MVGFHVGAMWITWSIINGLTRKELHLYKQFQVNTNRILQIFLSKMVTVAVHSTKNPSLFMLRLQNTHTMTLCHAV